MTGITGLVGSAFCAELLRRRNDIRIVAVARKSPTSGGLSATERVRETIREQYIFDGVSEEADKNLERIQVIEGEITDVDTLPSVDEFKKFDMVFHCAADVNLGKDPDGKTFNINYNGTKNILSLAEKAGVKAFHYVSTAYVCGKHDGLALEDQMQAKDFFNSYEKSKFEAEKLVRSSSLPFSIYRPSIVVGRRSDGKIRKPLAFYRLLEFLGKLKRHQCFKNKIDFSAELEFPLRVKTALSDSIYFVPIDYVQDAITTIFLEPVQNKAFHITGTSEVTTTDIEKTLANSLRLKGFERTEKIDKFTQLEELFHHFASDLFPYFSSKVKFDQANVIAVLKEKASGWRMDAHKLDMLIKRYYRDYFGLKG